MTHTFPECLLRTHVVLEAEVTVSGVGHNLWRRAKISPSLADLKTFIIPTRPYPFWRRADNVEMLCENGTSIIIKG